MPTPKWFTASEKVVKKFMADTYGEFKQMGIHIVLKDIAFIRYHVLKNKLYKVDRDKTIICTIDSGEVITVYEDSNRFSASEY